MDKSIIDRLVVCHYQMMAATAAAEKEGVYPCAGTDRRVHIGCGSIEELAKSVGIEVTVAPSGIKEFPIEKSFLYRGINFFGIFPEADYES